MRGRFDARALTLQTIRDHGLHVVPLRPAQIHAQQHLGPILAFGAAGARMDSHDGALPIVRAVEQHPGFEHFQALGKTLDLAVQIGRYVFAFASQFEQRVQIRSQARNLGLIGNGLLQALALLHDLLAFFRLLIPEIGIGDLLFDFG